MSIKKRCKVRIELLPGLNFVQRKHCIVYNKINIKAKK